MEFLKCQADKKFCKAVIDCACTPRYTFQCFSKIVVEKLSVCLHNVDAEQSLAITFLEQL